MRQELAEVLARMLGQDDRFFILPIYYAGGSVEADISAADLAAQAKALGAPVEVVSDRASLVKQLRETVREKDAILVMGARDESLTDLCREIVCGLESQPGSSVS